MEDWVTGELGGAKALENPPAGPELIVALSSYGVPTTPITDLLAALCVRAPIWVKPATGSDDFVARFVATLSGVDEGLGKAVEAKSWNRATDVGATILTAADTIVVTGRSSTIEEVKERLTGKRIIEHGPRLSVAIVTGKALAEGRESVVRALAQVTAFAGQLGCLSPVVAYVEGERALTKALADPLMRKCTDLWPAPPRKEGTLREKATWGEWSATVRLEGGEVVGDAADSWNVQIVSEATPPEPPPLPRILVLASVPSVEDVVPLCGSRRGEIACVGIAGTEPQLARFAKRMTAVGVERVTRLESMQSPPLTWRRDGRATLADLCDRSAGDGG